MPDDVIMTGPLFNGRAHAEAAAFCREDEKAIAEEAASRIKDFLPTQYKYLGQSGGSTRDNPVPMNAGFYESQIHAEAGAGGYRVTDSNVIYGPWLEGVSERNRAYRFPGYGAFRKISQDVDRDSLALSERKLPPYIAAMNGI